MTLKDFIDRKIQRSAKDGVLGRIASSFAQAFVHPSDVREGRIGDCGYQYAVITIGVVGSAALEPAAQVVLTPPGSIGGSVQVYPRMSKRPMWDNSVQLESIEFGERVAVFASSRALAFRVLSPDFMAWLLDQQLPPSLIFQDERCFVMFIGDARSTEERIAIAGEVAARIMHSGALQKPIN